MSDISKPEDRRLNLLQEMGIGPVWVRRDGLTAGIVQSVVPESSVGSMLASANLQLPPADQHAETASATTSFEPAAGQSDAEIARMDWHALQAAVAGCTRCHLCTSRRHTVFGTGDQSARWMLIGEGPGRNEDQQGEPFVGPAGKLLDNMLQAIDLRRGENNFIANVVKCRPIDDKGVDRAPTPEEAAACRPYLDRQIALVRPTTILALGKVAALSLLGGDPKVSVAALRGTVHRHNDIPLIVTYHPAYLLRKPLDKAKSWQDLCLARGATNSARPLVD